MERLPQKSTSCRRCQRPTKGYDLCYSCRLASDPIFRKKMAERGDKRAREEANFPSKEPDSHLHHDGTFYQRHLKYPILPRKDLPIPSTPDPLMLSSSRKLPRSMTIDKNGNVLLPQELPEP